MRKFLFYLIPIITLITFTIIMNAGNYMKKSRSELDNVLKHIDTTKKSIKTNNWNEARINAEKIEKAWEKVLPRIQLSVEREQINNFEVTIARLKGFLEAKDKAGCFAELSEAEEHWRDLGR